MGFFRVERGKDALFMENGDCWYAEPRYKMEKEVEEGKLVGSMYGVLPNKDWKEPVKAAEVRQTVF